MKSFVFAAALVFAAAPTLAQTIEELRALASGRSAELNEYRLLLQDANVPEQIIMVRALLASEDRELRQIAEEHALFSSNVSVRLEALRAIFDQKSTLLVNLSNLTSSNLTEAVRAFGGSFSTEDSTGLFSYTVGDRTAPDCWGSKGHTQRRCEVEIVGDRVLFIYDGNGWDFQGQLRITQTGILEGDMRYREGQPATVIIDLKRR